MIITVKNLHQQTFTVVFDCKQTVLQLKERIYNERGSDYAIEKQKLIYAGVILDDERTVASYNVDEEKFIVVMLKRGSGNYAQRPDEGTISLVTPATALDAISKGNPKPLEQGTSVSTDDDTKSGGSADGVGGIVGITLEPVGSNSSILSNESGASNHSGSSVGSGSSETSHSTFSSGDLAGVFSSTSLQSQAESNLLMGDEYYHTVESMIEMGYTREMVECAMAASFNNPERAVEYLVSGIPETQNSFNTTFATSRESVLLRRINMDTENVDNNLALRDGHRGGLRSDAALGDRPISSTVEIGDNLRRHGNDFREEHSFSLHNAFRRPDEEDPFEFLRNQPQFLQMRSLVYRNPDLLHAVLQQIGETNPALLQLISENQDAFLIMLNQPMEEQSSSNLRRMTPGRRAQLAAAARAAAGGDGLHIRSLDTAHGGEGDGPLQRQRPGESGDAGADTIPYDMLPSRPNRAAERRAAAADSFMRERADAVEAVEALTTATSEAVEFDAGSGENEQDNDRLTTPPSHEAMTGEDTIAIRLTPQDHDAIQRLKALGFPESLVLQAYIACEKDEQLAANLLISVGYDE